MDHANCFIGGIYAEEEIETICKNETTIKDIFSYLVKESIVILIVLTVIWFTIHNNTIEYVKSAFDIVIGFYIAKKGIER